MDLRSLNEEELKSLAVELGQKPFRGKQLFEWIHRKQIRSIDEMTNLPASFRDLLKEKYLVSGVDELEKQVSKKGDTAKYLFALPDGNVIESVWMKYRHGNSVCISSQVGCRMGCTFCASTLTGLTRNLTTGEMLSQIYEIQRSTGERVSNVIVMGMGEPLDNYDNLVKFIRLLSDEKGLCISQRSITVSTCGLVDKIRKLMEEKLQITLAISLHAPNDEIRKKTMPVANRYSIGEIFDVCREYFEKTGRRITFEYSMIRGVNDREEHALELVKRCRGLNCHINLIPLNEVKERNCLRSEESDIGHFKIILERNRINVTIRREMGGDIDAACGQLRKKFLDRTDEKSEEVGR
ncbi:MAG: 23S rRNA (adenine(2503)-C(2))-methyltransferase RlmN [Eubacterium sp.]|nr:23S rRNA (adenine(2503)-C(2))-methyltransferase RlmN [Eubacterium sp.]